MFIVSILLFVRMVVNPDRLGTSGLKEEAAGELESKHREKPSHREEGVTNYRRHKYSPRKRRNYSTPLGHSEQITMRREQCGV
jgi:hypothetical protein